MWKVLFLSFIFTSILAMPDPTNSGSCGLGVFCTDGTYCCDANRSICCPENVGCCKHSLINNCCDDITSQIK